MNWLLKKEGKNFKTHYLLALELAQYNAEDNKTYQAFLFANVSCEIELFIDTVIAKFNGDIYGTGSYEGILTPEFIEFFFEELDALGSTQRIDLKSA